MEDQATSTEMALARIQVTSESAELLERLKFTMALVNTGLRNLMLVNGGAMVALFTFLGSNGRAHILIRPASLWDAFLLFASGLVFVLFANLAAFWSQNQQYNVNIVMLATFEARAAGAPEPPLGIRKSQRLSRIFMYVGLACFGVSLTAFICGCAAALNGVLV